ncbi:hypothetical protein [Pseudogemmobacter sonorensis]|uniref:hypothetical protein n=1 Tax=Pseudogemmobacter sonorensis TaxID=2989681 RepID=UPI00367C3237
MPWKTGVIGTGGWFDRLKPAATGLVGGPVERLSPAGVIALHDGDLARLRPVLAVAEGDRVRVGTRLLSDRRRPWVVLVSPVAGRVARLEPGPRRGVAALEILPDPGEAGEAAEDGEVFDLSGAGTREGLVALMIEAGLWPALRTRPFGRVPRPEPSEAPEALFVTAMESAPGAPEASGLIAAEGEAFARGLAALRLLTPGRVWLCHAPGLTMPEQPGVTPRAFAGGRGAGLPGRHIHALHPVARGGRVWQIGWPEVIALGHLLGGGRISARRVVALSGPGVARPGLVSVLPGMALSEIAAGRLKPGGHRLLAGPEAGGLAIPRLRPGIRQITAIGQVAPAGGALGRLARRLRKSVHGTGALIPNAWDEHLAPPGIPALPLLHALASGDAEGARRLGALGLVEEDLAALGHVMRADTATLLRQTLDELEALA